MSSAAPATFPTGLRTLTPSVDKATNQVQDPKLATLNTADLVNTVKVRNPSTVLNEGDTCLAAQIYTGKSNEFIMDVSGLINGVVHTLAFTDVNAADVPYSAKNKIDTIVFTPTFSIDANGVVTRQGGTTGAFNSASGHPDVSLNILASGTTGLFDTARITVKDRINVYDGAQMQVVMTNANNTNKIEATASDSTPPPVLINGGPGAAPEFTVRIDASSVTSTTGVVSLDFGGKLAGVGIDISSIIVNYTDSTSLSFSSVTLNSVQPSLLNYTSGQNTLNQKKITAAMLSSGVLPGMFEIASANNKNYEFSAQLLDTHGRTGATGAANSLGILSSNAGPISGLSMMGIDAAVGDQGNTKLAMNGGLGGRLDVSWTAPAYLPSPVVGYRVYYLSGATDLSNNLNHPSTGRDTTQNPAVGNRGKWRFLLSTAKAKGQFVETTGTATTVRFSLPNSKVASGTYTDVSRQYYAFPIALTLDSAGNKVEGDALSSGIVDATNTTGTDQGAGKPIEGCPSAPSGYKLIVGKELQANADDQTNANLTNRLKIAYYDDKVDNRGSVVTQAKAAIFRTKDVPFLPAIIADGSYNTDISFDYVGVPDDGIDFIDLSQNVPTGSTADDFIFDYYDDVSKQWRKIRNQDSQGTKPWVKYNNAQLEGGSFKNGESYTVFLKYGNANGFSNERTAGKSATISTLPNIRAWMMPGKQNLSGTALDVKLLGDIQMGVKNSASAANDRLIDRDASNSYINASNSASTDDAAAHIVTEFPLNNGTANAKGKLDSSFALIGDGFATLKWKETLDISGGTWSTAWGSQLLQNAAKGVPVNLYSTPGSSLDVASGGSEITYLKYQVHTTYVNGAGATTNVDTAAKRFAAADPQYANRLGGEDAAPADAQFAYMTNFTNSVHFSTDISGGHYAAVNTTSSNGAADGAASDELVQKTIQVPYKKGDGKITIGHYYDASGNPQKLKNGLRYKIKLWGGNANGDDSASDVSFTNVVPRGTPIAGAADFKATNNATITIVNNKRRYSQAFSFTDISGIKEGKGQFYQHYYVRAEQFYNGKANRIAHGEATPATLGRGTTTTITLTGDANAADALYGYPITISITGKKASSTLTQGNNTATALVTSCVDKSADLAGNGTTRAGTFGEDGADVSGATVVKVFELPLSATAGENEVARMSAVASDKKATISWSQPNPAVLYVPNAAAGEAATAILGYTITLYDASMGIVADNTGFDNNSRRATVAAVKTQGHVGGDQSVEFDGLVNGKVYIPRITTTYAYGAVGNRYTATTEGGYLGKLTTATSAAPTADPLLAGFVQLPDLTYGNNMLTNGTDAVIPRGLPIVTATAATGGNKLVVDDNGSALTNALMLQISPAPTGTAPSVFSYDIEGAATGNGITEVNFHSNNSARLVKTFPNSILGNNWNSEINYLFVANAAGTTVGVTNLDTATLGDNVIKIA